MYSTADILRFASRGAISDAGGNKSRSRSEVYRCAAVAGRDSCVISNMNFNFDGPYILSI